QLFHPEIFSLSHALSPVVFYLHFFLFVLYCYCDHRDLHSFPTRRSSDLGLVTEYPLRELLRRNLMLALHRSGRQAEALETYDQGDRKSTRLNSSHQIISYAVFCLKKKNTRYEHK